MKISSWNVNSVRARILNIIKYIKSSNPDILMIQEIKTEEKNFPFSDFNSLGYKSYVFGQKSYNGIAFLSKKNIKNINTKFINDEKKQSRIIVADVESKSNLFKLINVYAPNGNPVQTEKYDYKKNWYNKFIKQIEKILIKNKNIIIGGDFNIIPEEKDVYNPNDFINDALFTLEIRKKYKILINLGFHDVFRNFNKKEGNYTFWDYQKGSWQKNNGLRIDHILVSSSLIDNVKKVEIIKSIRSQPKPSDHVPLECVFR